VIFHKEIIEGRSFAPGSKAATGRTYETDYAKVALALGVMVLMATAAFIGRWLAWPEAASAFLHLTEVSAGGIIGMFYGERTAIRTR
jgi:hypothetical protein